ncbi:CheR family methyltransferase [Paludibacterium paludis]|uniref:Protein-glutamate O-methyltransferase n=1 Tax=Paludibacterium paludis TaxID=1225769 RepID=A0A918P4H1_9NEIS|nr:protein-glutamate O-methyltransferase CheR [Paludibacterium paludis]GGY22255.1 protein-glutamate O-methyltransferase [Paludibacterium paludis]
MPSPQAMEPSFRLAMLAERIDAWFGLHYPPARWGDLLRAMNNAAAAFGAPSAEALVLRLLSGDPEPRHLEMLATHLTIGETYFFRERVGLEVIRDFLVPDWLARHRGDGRPLRIWCAGCSTGEEPYSLSMLLDGAANPVSGVECLATDINKDALDRARGGVFGDWSLRNTPSWLKSRYFQPLPDGRFALSPAIRGSVSFDILNLADGAGLERHGPAASFDIILCRNVLMYFSAERITQVCQLFHRALADKGWLLVGLTEAPNLSVPGLEPVQLGGITVFRKTCVGVLAEPLVPVGMPDLSDAPDSAPPPCSEAVDACEMARGFADQARWVEAREWCETALRNDKLNPVPHFLLAHVEEATHRPDMAIRSLRRALYLYPDFIAAQFAFGRIELALGKREAARRHFGRARDALAQMPPDEIVAETGGLTAGRLIQILCHIEDGVPA